MDRCIRIRELFNNVSYESRHTHKGEEGDGRVFFNKKGTFVNENVIDVYRRYRMWDFSASNVVRGNIACYYY